MSLCVRHLPPSKHLYVNWESSHVYIELVLACCSPWYGQHIICSPSMGWKVVYHPLLNHVCQTSTYCNSLFSWTSYTLLEWLPPCCTSFVLGRKFLPLLQQSPHSPSPRKGFPHDLACSLLISLPHAYSRCDVWDGVWASGYDTCRPLSTFLLSQRAPMFACL